MSIFKKFRSKECWKNSPILNWFTIYQTQEQQEEILVFGSGWNFGV